jgi:hypothetical protein
MSRKVFLGVAILAVVCVLLSTPAFAEIKFSGGGSERLRHEFWRNWKDVQDSSLDNRNFFRLKTSLWGQADYEKDLSFYGKLTNEFRAHTYFGGASGSYPDKASDKKGYRFDINEVVVDNLYLDVKNVLDAPVDLRLGRQDFLGPTGYGEGFLIADGTPSDGSRTFYFNAAKASWRMDEQNTLDFIYINNPRDEEFLPVINRTKFVKFGTTQDKVPQSLNTTDELGGILYWKNKAIKDLALEGYYIYKKEAEEGGAGYQSQKGEINTIGSFAKYAMSPWTLRGQLAYQFGKYGSNDREAIGGYGFIDRDFQDVTWKPQASLGYVYLSGDNRKTAKNEAWDPLFSRYPWYSEVYSMTYSAETSILCYWTNTQMIRTSLVVKPTEKIKLSFWYNYLRANAQVAATSTNGLSGTKKERGHLPQARLDYAVSKNISTYFLAEYFIPEKFYVGKDPALFLRTEVQIKF